MVIIFNIQNSHLLTLSLLTEEFFQVNGQNRWRQRRVTCQQLIGYINTCEKIGYLFKCIVTDFLGAEIPV